MLTYSKVVLIEDPESCVIPPSDEASHVSGIKLFVDGCVAQIEACRIQWWNDGKIRRAMSNLQNRLSEFKRTFESGALRYLDLTNYRIAGQKRPWPRQGGCVAFSPTRAQV